MPRPRPAVDRRHDELVRINDRVKATANLLANELRLVELPTSGRSHLDPIPRAYFGAMDTARQRYEAAVRQYNQAHRQHVKDRCCVV